ncbi:hypothetical protein KOW79_005820 [Hemibagrus wyckioides]|uniref:CRAL-TRIO domain-containing protein n=1 Tax=Hemibagrus wyckioides TaxID=337641 RepID=A0A9D3SP05_9TELE|nr:hypothetical protein KOW79_005820 [Hemibagrus wyckioides]
MSDCTTEVRFSPSLPSECVLRSGAVIFPGVYDQLGYALVVFPVEFQSKLLCDVTKEEVAEFVCYCLRLHSKSRSECLVSVVADLRDASVAVTRRMAEILLLLQLHQRTVHSFYAVQPKKRDVQKLLQKLLSSNSKCSPAVKCVFLREVFELSNYVDRSQLPADLGGYFIYSHESWVSFIKEMDSFVQEFVAVVRKLPVCISALQDFSKLSVPTEYEPLAVFCSTNQARLQHLRRDLGLDALFRRCECVLEKFRYPERDPCYQAMVGTVLFTHTALEMLQNYDRIKAAVEKVELLWRRVFSSALLRLQVLQLQRDADQVVCEMECLVQKMQSYTPEALRDSNTAETLQLEFNTSVYTHAVMLVRRAEDVLNTVPETVVRQNQEGYEWINDLERRTNQLRAVMEVQNRNLNSICTFHQCYHKIQRWYSVAVCERFLQDLLWRTCPNKYDKEEKLLSHKQTKVFSVIEDFLRLHPPPDVGELKQLAQLANLVPDAHLENAGKQLTKRCSTLRKLLISPGSVKFSDLQMAMQWQYEYLKGKTVDSPSDFHTQRNMCDQNVYRDSDFFPVNANVLTRHHGANYQSGTKPPSLSSFDSGFDGAGSGHLETGGGKTCQDEAPRSKSPLLHVNEKNASSSSEGLVEEKSLRAPSIHIIPNVSGDTVNFEITVKRSATLPKNPWLSLPVDDLENCYTVIISPTQQRETRSCDQLTQTTDTSMCDLQNQSTEWSPIGNVLSSTITDGAETSEAMPTLLWDSYDLHESDSVLLGEPDFEWEIKEQQELRAVEEMLSRTAGILQEEESVLAQEEILDVLLEADSPYRLWPSWSKACEFTQMTSSDLAEAGVIGLEDDLISLNFGTDDVFSQKHPSGVATPPSEAGSDPLFLLETGNGGPDRSELLKEIENLKALEEKIVEENLKISELRSSESKETMISPSLSENRKRFLEKLEQEKKEVEEMERNLSMEMKKSKPKCLSKGRKIVRCSVMGKGSVLREDDEALLMSCKSSAQVFNHGQPCLEKPTNQQPSDIAGHHVHYEGSYPEASIDSKCLNVTADSSSTDSMNISLNFEDQQNIDSPASSLLVAVPSVIAGDVLRCDIETKMTDLVSSVLNLSNAEGPDIGESKTLLDPHDSKEEKYLEPSEILESTERCNTDLKEETLMSEVVSSTAFDPGGPSPLPQSSKLKIWISTDFEENASDAVNQTAVSTSSASSVDSIPVECKIPCRTSSVELKHHNTNNNNLHTLDLRVGVENVPEEPEDQKPETWCESLVSRNQSPLLETSETCGATENNEVKVRVHLVDSAVTRHVCRSPVLQLHICTREMSDFQTPVVLDTGSSLVKAGFADQDLPTTIFPTAVGRPKYMVIVERDVYVGHDAQHMRGVLTLHYPMRNGVVSDWDQMEMIWSHAFEQLRVCSEDHPVLLTEGVVSVRENRQHSIQLMFESFNVPLAYMALQPVLALYATGRTTGLVFDSGDGVSHSVPVFDGYCLPHAVQRFNLAGNDITLHLKQLLMEQGVCMRTSAEMEIVREIKEKCCFVALNYEAELGGGGRAGAQMHYTLPDGHVISLTMERFRAPEILFRPELIGQDYYGMHESIFRSVLRSDVDLRRDLVGNIVLSGGNTLLAGLPERLQHEISGLAPVGLGERVKVTSSPDRDFSVWRGGAVLANMPSFSSAWISQEEYEEFGPQIVFRKCF